MIDTTTHEKKGLPYKEISTIKFLENEFTGDSLIITYTDEVVRIRLDELLSDMQLD